MNEKGFTLIEIIIAMAIIGILSAIVIPTFKSYQVKSYHSSSASDVRNLLLFEQSFYTDHTEYVAVTAVDKNSSGFISKTVTLQGGKSVLFEVNGLSTNSTIIVSIDATKQYANIGSLHKKGTDIIAIESDLAKLKNKNFSGTFTSSDMPAATAATDLSSWSDWGN